jgi:hypothetical protein
MRLCPPLLLALVAITVSSRSARAAELPDHEPIAVLIVSDGVNPHGLPPHLLTEPGDLREAIATPGSGIETSVLQEVDSDCIDDALELLDADTVDVMIYFAHRSARACDGTDQQAALTSAMRTLLMAGGGIVVFHHGLYADDGKEEVLQLLGGRADDYAWSPEAGQNVIATARDHFITNYGLSYEGQIDFSAAELGVEDGRYPWFNNTPDERYPGLRHLEEPGEDRTLLFASDYDGPQILSYDLRRPHWVGHVIFYQPGEYKPNALDDLDGNNFQILANAIHFAGKARHEPPPEDDEPEDEHTPPDEDDGSSTGEEPSPDATTNDDRDDLADATDSPGRCAVTHGHIGWAWTPWLAALVRRREPRRRGPDQD